MGWRARAGSQRFQLEPLLTAEETMGTAMGTVPHFSTFTEVVQLMTPPFKADLERAAYSNYAVKENERREQDGRGELRKAG